MVQGKSYFRNHWCWLRWPARRNGTYLNYSHYIWSFSFLPIGLYPIAKFMIFGVYHKKYLWEDQRENRGKYVYSNFSNFYILTPKYFLKLHHATILPAVLNLRSDGQLFTSRIFCYFALTVWIISISIMVNGDFKFLSPTTGQTDPTILQQTIQSLAAEVQGDVAT